MKEPKYKIGDKVWILGTGRLSEITIKSITVQKDVLFYSASEFGGSVTQLYKHNFIDESQIFPTKEALIESL